ncbi:MAG TPA: TIM barrel protein [Chloroflexota bacterium]|nr:TIM barrel protein [Chloroflexota bacterium]
MISVGTASVTWGFDPLYDWTSPPTFDQLLAEMATAGYEGTEISYHFSTDSEELRTALRRHGLRAAATFHQVRLLDRSRHDEETARAMTVADRLQALGSDVLILSDHTTPQRVAVAGRVAADGSDGLSESQWRNLAEGLNRIGEQLRLRGMRGVLHPHVGTYVETRAEIDRVLALTDPDLLGLCPDTGHLAYGGSDPEAVFVDYASRIWYVHLKDIDADKLEQARSRRLSLPEAVKNGLFVPLGDGMVDLARMIGALRGSRYQGWIIPEQDAPDDPLAAATRSREYLRRQFDL